MSKSVRLALLGLGFLTVAASVAAQPAPSGPRFQVAGKLSFPSDPGFAVAANPTGGFLAAWQAEDGLRVGRFNPAGTPTGPSSLIHQPWFAGQLQLTVGQGRGLVVWIESLLPHGFGLFGRRLDAAGRPAGRVLRLDSGESNAVENPRVAVDGAGSFVIAWSEVADNGSSSSPAFSLHIRRLAASGSFLGPDTRLPDSRRTRRRTLGSLLRGRSGGLILVGTVGPSNGAAPEVFFLRLGADLRPRGEAVQVAPIRSDESRVDPAAAVGGDGRLVIVWSVQRNSDPPAIFRRRFNAAGQPVEPAVRLVTGGTDPVLAAEPGGGFLFAWRATEGLGTVSRAFAQRMEASGARGPRFPIDAPPVETFESAPKLAVLGPGRFAAVWNSYGWENALFGQVFASATAGTLQLRLGRMTVPEGGGEAVLDVVRREGSRGAVSAAWEVRGVEAAPGTDFAAASGIVSFADGDSQPKRIVIPIVDDAQPEGDETFQVVLRDPDVGAVLGQRSRATLEIRDDDTPSPLLAGAGAVFPVASYGDGEGSLLCCSQVTRLSSGRFVVTWLDLTSRGYHTPDSALFFHVYSAGGELLTSSAEVGENPFSPKVLPQPGGGFLLLWQDDPNLDDDESPVQGFVQRFDGDGNALGARLEAPSLANRSPATAPAPDGGFVAMFPKLREGISYDLLAERYDAEGRSLGNPFLINERPIARLSGSPPFQLSATGSGGFVAVWERRPGPGSLAGGFFARRFSLSGVLGAELAVAEGPVTGLPDLAALPGGGFAATWQGEDGDGWGVFARWFDAAGAPLTGAYQVADSAAGDQSQPAIAAGTGGDVLIAWRGANRVYAQFFTAPGRRSGARFALDPEGENEQYAPALAAAENGYVAAWISSNGEPYGVKNLQARQLARP